MPDSSGQFKGISVSRLYPGHRDYQPPQDDVLKWVTPGWVAYVKKPENDGRPAQGEPSKSS